ncbi:MAG: hypothetical protein Marn2KO_26000 [Marinobacter nauticus]
MDIRVDEQADLTVWTLEPSLTIYDVQDLHEQALASLPETGQLVINGESVEDIDSAGLQWLLAIHRWTRDQGINFLLELGDSSVTQLLDLFHAHGLLGLPAILIAANTDPREASNADR